MVVVQLQQRLGSLQSRARLIVPGKEVLAMLRLEAGERYKTEGAEGPSVKRMMAHVRPHQQSEQPSCHDRDGEVRTGYDRAAERVRR